MSKLIETLCSKMCGNYFENSSNSCISHINIQDKIFLLLKPSTLLEVKITRQIQNFCQKTKNRFWSLYYRISETEIDFKCNQSYKSDLCQDYILNRIIKYIKSFDIKQESIVFQKVRANLTNKDSSIEDKDIDKNTKEIIAHYIQKIINEYQNRCFDFDSGSAIIENVALQKDKNIKSILEMRLNRYRVYRANIILKSFIYEALNSDKEIKETALIELLHKEKFINYIKQIINSRFIDFTRSKQYKNENIIEPSEKITINSEENIDIEKIFQPLNSEQKIIYKLKNGISLDNREFLSITYKMNYLSKEFIDSFTPQERLYIKFSIQFNIDDDSPHFNILDVPKVKESISKKISNYRENLLSNSYIDKKEEIFIKLIYTEPLSAKEIGTVLNLTSKQINKRVETIKKRLQKL